MKTATKDKKQVKPITVEVTLADFDTQEPFRVTRDGQPITEFVPMTSADYNPRGGTPLRDATAKMIAHLAERQQPGRVVVGLLLDRSGSMGGKEQAVISGINEFVGGMAAVEKVDPAADGTVLCVVVTDGQENSSTEVSAATLAAMTAEKEKSGFTFIYMGANQDAWDTGAQMGFSGGMTGQTLNYTDTVAGTSSALRAAGTRGVAYLGDHGSLASFSSKATITEDGTESDENFDPTKAVNNANSSGIVFPTTPTPIKTVTSPVAPGTVEITTSEDALKKATDALKGD